MNSSKDKDTNLEDYYMSINNSNPMQKRRSTVFPGLELMGSIKRQTYVFPMMKNKTLDVLELKQQREREKILLRQKQGMWNLLIAGTQKDRELRNGGGQNSLMDNIKIILKIIYDKIIEYELSTVGCLLMVVFSTMSLLLYEVKILAIPGRYHKISFIINIFFIVYHFLDLIFRTVIIERFLASVYFLIDLVSTVCMIFDLTHFAYRVWTNILFNEEIEKKKVRSYSEDMLIEHILRFFQVVKLLRVIKIYKLTMRVIRKFAKEKRIKEICRTEEEKLQKKMKTTKENKENKDNKENNKDNPINKDNKDNNKIEININTNKENIKDNSNLKENKDS